MDAYPFAVGFSLAIGAGLFVHALLSSLFTFGRRWLHVLGSRHYRLHALGIDDLAKNTRTDDEILGLSSIPWVNMYTGAAVIGLALFFWIGPYLPSARLAFLAAPGLVWLFKGYLVRQRRRFLLGQIRQLLIDLRLHMSLRGSLLLGLENIVQTTHENNLVYRVLKLRTLGGQAKSGLDVLRQVAEDLKSAYLVRIVQRIQAAQQSGGVLTIDKALVSSIDELTDEINSQTDEQMQRLPLRITLLAMPFLLGPIVILFFYPLVDRILQTLSGTGIGGGF